MAKSKVGNYTVKRIRELTTGDGTIHRLSIHTFQGSGLQLLHYSRFKQTSDTVASWSGGLIYTVLASEVDRIANMMPIESKINSLR